MNKLTKVSLTALCGSLATLTAANAGDLSATGAAHMTWTSKSKSETGNPLGMKSNITFSGSGELDGGQAISFNITHKTHSGAMSHCEPLASRKNLQCNQAERPVVMCVREDRVVGLELLALVLVAKEGVGEELF